MIFDFASMTARLRAFAEGCAAARRERPADFWHGLLFWAFWLSLASFPVGYGMREVMPLVCVLFLVPYYRHAWHKSVLARLRVWWLFLCVALMTAVGVLFSPDPVASLLHAGTGVNKGFILPFIAMECVRDGRDLRRLVWACVFVCFWEGIDGVWQAATGRDFIMGYKLNARRLTGSLGDYTVGNYIALALIPAFGVWFILRRGLGRWASALIFLALFWPAFFLCIGAASRSGLLAIAAAVGLWQLLRGGCARIVRAVVGPALVFAVFYLCQAPRLHVERIAGDGRWSLWELAWRVFLEHPWLGAGAGRYNAAFRELGLAPAHDALTISHPHDLYLDLLYAHGIVGFSLGMIFLLGFLWWGWRKIRPQLMAECRQPGNGIYWRLAAWFWLGYAGWLVNGIFGHDFYRIWWLGLAMSHLGVMIGAVVNGVPAEGEAEGAAMPPPLPQGSPAPTPGTSGS